jgi:hypothetical protein
MSGAWTLRSAAAVGSDANAPLPGLPGTSPFHIKGMPYRGFLHLIKTAIKGGLDAFCSDVGDQALRVFIRQPFLASGRYDVLPLVPLFAVAARQLGMPFDELVRTAAAAQCRYDARTVFKTMFGSSGANDMADRFTRFNAQYYDFGKYAGTAFGPNHLLLESAEVPLYLYVWQGPMHIAYAEETARILGAHDVRIVSHVVGGAGRRGNYRLVTQRTELTWAT